MKRTILIVEDEPAILELVTNILLGAGEYEVLCAGSGSGGLRLAFRFEREIHLLLANVILEGGTLGTDLATAIKEQRPDMRVILMSGKGEGELAALAGGGWQFLKKPFVAEELLALVQGQLGIKTRTA